MIKRLLFILMALSFAVMPMAAELPEALAQQEGEFGLQMLAHRDGTDGFYVCRMRRVKA